MIKYSIFFLLFCIYLPSTFAQDIQDPACGTDEIDAYFSRTYPGKEGVAEFETWMVEAKARMHREEVKRQIFTVPVIFHLIHNGLEVGEGANMTFDKVMEQVEILNEDFRRKPGTDGFNENGVDTEIEFCPAFIDPEGIPLKELGIHRVNTQEMGLPAGPYSSDVMSSTIQPNTFWDPSQYMNIWVVDGISSNGNNVAGYAFLPQSPGIEGLPRFAIPEAIDGIVIGRPFFGRGNSDVTVTHEVGHFLGLRHILGGSLGQVDGDVLCSLDDFCDDTPLTSGENQGCNIGSATSCGSLDPLENYMIATVGRCRNAFTECQKSRMRTVLLHSPNRFSLLNSNVCQVPTSAPVADFALENTFSCDGTFQLRDSSENFPSNWFWIFSNGKVDSVRNPVVEFEQPGTYTVTLISNNFLGSSIPVSKTFTIDLDGSRVQAGQDIFECLGEEVQLRGSFEGNSAVNISWSPKEGLSNPDILTPTLTVQQSQSYILSAESDKGCKISDTIEVKAAPRPTTFALGETSISPGDTAQLTALGANSFIWSPDSSLDDPTVATPKAFPTETTLYKVIGLNNENCAKADSVLITVNTTTSIDRRSFGNNGNIFAPFPNPANKQVTFSAALAQNAPLKLSIMDLQGKILFDIYHQERPQSNFSFQWQRPGNLPPGAYMVVWEMNKARYFQPILIQ